jgi:hypothetical protein
MDYCSEGAQSSVNLPTVGLTADEADCLLPVEHFTNLQEASRLADACVKDLKLKAARAARDAG